jgi:hypothetical protein
VYSGLGLADDRIRKPPRTFEGAQREEDVVDDADLLESLGVPQLMTERFKVVCSSRHGLIATADPFLRDHFDIHPTQTISLPASDGSGNVDVELKAPWRIHLGTKVTLDSDDDDGILFLLNLITEIFATSAEDGEPLEDGSS